MKISKTELEGMIHEEINEVFGLSKKDKLMDKILSLDDSKSKEELKGLSPRALGSIWDHLKGLAQSGSTGVGRTKYTGGTETKSINKMAKRDIGRIVRSAPGLEDVPTRIKAYKNILGQIKAADVMLEEGAPQPLDEAAGVELDLSFLPPETAAHILKGLNRTLSAYEWSSKAAPAAEPSAAAAPEEPAPEEPAAASAEIEKGDSFAYTSRSGKESAVQVVDPENAHGATVAQKIDPASCAPVKNSQFASKPEKFAAAVGEPIEKCSTDQEDPPGAEEQDKQIKAGLLDIVDAVAEKWEKLSVATGDPNLKKSMDYIEKIALSEEQRHDLKLKLLESQERHRWKILAGMPERE